MCWGCASVLTNAAGTLGMMAILFLPRKRGSPVFLLPTVGSEVVFFKGVFFGSGPREIVLCS